MTMIELREMRKTYGEKVAVERLSLSVAEGEIFAFLGPNGAGKTTTIKVLAGLLRPDSGYAAVGGFDLQRDGLQARAIMSYVPDEPHLYDKLTAREFLHMTAELYGMSRADAAPRIAQSADVFELNEFIDSLIEGFSHGMKQRTVIAAALLHEPRLLVIDEPMVGLDPRSARTVKDVLRKLSRERGMTVFMSTHTLSVAEEIADRVGILNKGKLVALGTVGELHGMRTAEKAEGHGRLEDLFLELTATSDDATGG
ncbi:MAG TPA: ABC transporter ATP-binding protein [Planctomycetota bacterium]|nr:ABC transporter ATP-binding protein [Planctomycetota bacterium]